MSNFRFRKQSEIPRHAGSWLSRMPSTRRTNPVIVYYSNPDHGGERCFCQPSKTSKKSSAFPKQWGHRTGVLRQGRRSVLWICQTIVSKLIGVPAEKVAEVPGSLTKGCESSCRQFRWKYYLKFWSPNNGFCEGCSTISLANQAIPVCLKQHSQICTVNDVNIQCLNHLSLSSQVRLWYKPHIKILDNVKSACWSPIKIFGHPCDLRFMASANWSKTRPSQRRGHMDFFCFTKAILPSSLRPVGPVGQV